MALPGSLIYQPNEINKLKFQDRQVEVLRFVS